MNKCTPFEVARSPVGPVVGLGGIVPLPGERRPWLEEKRCSAQGLPSGETDSSRSAAPSFPWPLIVAAGPGSLVAAGPSFLRVAYLSNSRLL